MRELMTIILNGVVYSAYIRRLKNSMTEYTIYDTEGKVVEFCSPLEMVCVRSERRGMSSLPRPPSFLGVFIQARWVKWESTEQANTSAPIFLNSATRSLKARISVGQTNVKSSG